MAYVPRVNEYQQKQIIYDCFNGNQHRDCDNCPALHTRGGVCCFSHPKRFDEADDTERGCQNCTYFEECRQEVIDFQQAQLENQAQMTYTTLPRQTPASRFAQVAQKYQQRPDSTVQVGGSNVGLHRTVITKPVDQVRAIQPPVEEGQTMMERFTKDTVWGAGQGFFEMAAEFFRRYRWR